jgi:hypothetical protein
MDVNLRQAIIISVVAAAAAAEARAHDVANAQRLHEYQVQAPACGAPGKGLVGLAWPRG